MRNLTARFTKTAPVLATALLCTAALAQEQSVTPRPVNGTPALHKGQTIGGIAGSVLYANTVETGSRYNPTASTVGPQLYRVLDDIPVPLTNTGGATTIDVTKVTYGIRRIANAPAATITGYWSTVTTEATAPDTQLDVPETLIGSVALPANGTASVTELVSFGDGTSTLFTVDLNDTIIAGGFGTFALGLSIDPPSAAGQPSELNGWRITNGPDANADAFWRHDPNDDSEAFLFFGGAPVATFYIIVEGAASVGDPCLQPLPFCSGDVANGDGVVNVDDLLVVINTWGQTGPPRPAGDCAPQPNGDCVVNVDDLLAVINQWGNCPTPSGACCLPNGSCLSAQSPAQCASAGGTYQGNGSSCDTAKCVVLPPNDECANALAVTTGVNDVSNLNATTSQGIPGGACAFNGAANFTRDVWFSFNASSGGVLSVDVCGTTGAVTDTVLSIFSGTCGSLTELACDDDSCAAPNPELLSSASTTVPSAGTYLIRVGSWANGPTGPLALNVAFQPQDNDVCTFATVLPTLPASTTGSLTGSTIDESAGCNSILPGFGRWYQVTGNGNTLTASTCIPCTPGVNCPLWNARLHVYCGVSCSSLFCVAGVDANSCSFFQESVSWCSAPGQTYWILVSNPDGPTGDYTLNVTSNATPCANPAACGLVNDECANALTVVNGANNIDGTGATTSAGIPGGLCTGAATNFTNDSWYKYTPTLTGFTEFKLCDSAVQEDDVLAILSGTCAALTEIGCDDDGCIAGTFAIPSIVSVQTTAGSQVFVRVGIWNNTFPGGPRTLTITPGQGGCPGCQAGSNLENLPCRVNGDVANQDPNGGCNNLTGGGTPGFSGPVLVGEEWCGIGSNYVNSANVQSRDTDWYEFTATADGDYTITACATFPLHIGFVENGTDVTLCPGASAFVGGGGVFVAPNVVGSITRTLVAGNTYAVFMAPQTATSGVVCPPAGETNYHFTVTGP